MKKPKRTKEEKERMLMLRDEIGHYLGDLASKHQITASEMISLLGTELSSSASHYLRPEEDQAFCDKLLECIKRFRKSKEEE